MIYNLRLFISKLLFSLGMAIHPEKPPRFLDLEEDIKKFYEQEYGD